MLKKEWTGTMKLTKKDTKLDIFVDLLCAIDLPRDTIMGLCAMVEKNEKAMDAIVDFIDENPNRTESEIIKKASEMIRQSSAER